MSHLPLTNNGNPMQLADPNQHGYYASPPNPTPSADHRQQQYFSSPAFQYNQPHPGSTFEHSSPGLQLSTPGQFTSLPNLRQSTPLQRNQNQRSILMSSNGFGTANSSTGSSTRVSSPSSYAEPPSPASKEETPQQNQTSASQIKINPAQMPAPPNSTNPATEPTARDSVTRFLMVPNLNTVPAARVPPTLEAYANKTSDELRAIALAKSKKVMTREDELYFFQYYELQKVELTLAAINRRVSMSMIENLMGRKQAVRGASGWNNFQAKNNDVFKGKGQGVRNSGGMKKLSPMWWDLTSEQRDTYKNKKLPAIIEEDESDASTDAPNLAAVTGLRAHSKSLKLAEKRVDKFMKEWNQKALNIAASNHCELVMFAVSNHLQSNNFQLAYSTPGAAEFVKQMYEADGIQNYQSRIQSYCTGAKLNAISAAVTQKKTKKGVNNEAVTQARAKLAEFVSRETEGRKTSWSWQGCDKALGRLGYKVVFLPGTLSNPEWIKSASNRLLNDEAKLIMDDIDQDLIRIVKDKDALMGHIRQPVKPAASRISQKKTSVNRKGSPDAENQNTTNPQSGSAATKKRKRNNAAPPKKRKQRKRLPSLTLSERALDSNTSDEDAQSDSGTTFPARRFRPTRLAAGGFMLSDHSLANNTNEEEDLQARGQQVSSVPHSDEEEDCGPSYKHTDPQKSATHSTLHASRAGPAASLYLQACN
ncbi:hypothetical protein PTTG_06551 [Puccinia triticina 1-1 BBBD Race 1]|uniref:Uncharacterized protein n=1 Tax=Puccinia triticina (isolate 1-1 / race 1 (BBBD)) TaxID=630390 RepID=A0A180GED4_PUCT1|nr:hypothetical protein PTTG_06551 [Puccinia triticina 1-1 BBBD Race 1]